ncbi:MAG: SMC-Scp complex subunit ScpB [Clostridia bacterium]|nr:SMC-Scp complex subunit ScpB [Clostridia bacterium]
MEQTLDPKESIQQLKNIEGAIEAILYAAGYPVKYAKIAEVLGLDVRNTKQIIRHMSETYNADTSKHGLNLLLFDETCQFCTKEQYAPYIREALGIRRGGNLSASSMEVLAVIAYNQPVTRSFVDQVRGVDSSYAFNSLIDKGLIEACGRLDAPGRPMLYITTEKFLRVFGIQSLSELPATETMIPPKEDTPIISDDTADEEGGVTTEAEADEAEISAQESMDLSE